MEKTLEIHLQEQREQIIKDIERRIPYGSFSDITMIYKEVIAHIRGSYK